MMHLSWLDDNIYCEIFGVANVAYTANPSTDVTSLSKPDEKQRVTKNGDIRDPDFCI